MVLATSAGVAGEINCGYVLGYSKIKSPEEDFKRAFCHVENNDLKEANKILEKIGKKLPELQDNILYYRSLYYNQEGNSGRAKKYLERILKDYPDSALKEKISILLAEIYIRDGKYDDAEDLYRDLVQNTVSDWTRAKYLKLLGELYEKQKDTRQAFVTYQKIWSEYPTVSFSNYIFEFANKNSLVFLPRNTNYLSRADFFYSKSLWQNALVEFEKAPQTPEVLTKTAVCHYRLGNYRKAVDILSEIKSAEALYWIGNSTRRNGYSTDAAKMLSSIYRFYPESEFSSRGLFEAAQIYESRGRKNDAIKTYNELISRYPESEKGIEGAWNLAWIHYNSRNYDEALKIFSGFSYPSGSFNEHSFKYWEARTLEKLGNTEKSTKIFSELSSAEKITYHSYLAGIKPGVKVKGPEAKKVDFDNMFNGNRAFKKNEILIKMGIYKLVADEIDYLQTISSTADQNLFIASLYDKLGDFYSAIKFATLNDSNALNHLSYPDGFSEYVKRFSGKYGLDELLVYSLIREESRFDQNAVSSSNARGLMQLIPLTAWETAGKVGIYDFNLDKLFTPEINVELGCFYLSYVLERFNSNIPLALAGYNAGPTRAEEWYGLRGNLPVDEFIEKIPFDETRFYVKRIIRSYGAYKAIYGK